MGFIRLAPLLGVLLVVGCCKDKDDAATSDRELSAFAQRIHTQLESATDPFKPNDRDADALARTMSGLRQRRELLRAELAGAGSDDKRELDRQRIQLIRVERQMEMIDRLMTRYEQNAPAVATGH